MNYLLDTNICIHLFKGQADLAQKINTVGVHTCYLSEITIAELMYGVENSASNRQAANRENLNWLRTAFDGRILQIGESFQEYAEQKTMLRRIGRPVGEFDLLIGTTAITHGLILVTRNIRDFQHLEGILLENWIDA